MGSYEVSSEQAVESKTKKKKAAKSTGSRSKEVKSYTLLSNELLRLVSRSLGILA